MQMYHICIFCSERMGRLAEFINKDTQIKNETKRMTVIIRKLCLTFVALSVVNLFLNAFWLHSLRGVLLWCGSILIDGLTFYISYHASKNIVLTVFVIQKCIWILAATMLYGWEGGFQFFLILLMILYSFGESGYNGKKLIFDIVCFVMFVVFVLFFKGNDGVIPIAGMDRIIQILNILVFCVSVAWVSSTFSTESQEYEEKIVKYNEQLKIEAGEDALTGLKNRRSTKEVLEKLVDNKIPFSICMCDIDYFKNINDTYGHEFGDEVLVAISCVFKKMTTDNEYVSRWGGEEFLLIFPRLNGDDAYMKVDRIKDEIKKIAVPHGDKNVSITMTYGLTEYDLGKNLEHNIKEVDEKLYMGKQSGRDRIVY